MKPIVNQEGIGEHLCNRSNEGLPHIHGHRFYLILDVLENAL